MLGLSCLPQLWSAWTLTLQIAGGFFTLLSHLPSRPVSYQLSAPDKWAFEDRNKRGFCKLIPEPHLQQITDRWRGKRRKIHILICRWWKYQVENWQNNPKDIQDKPVRRDNGWRFIDGNFISDRSCYSAVLTATRTKWHVSTQPICSLQHAKNTTLGRYNKEYTPTKDAFNPHHDWKWFETFSNRKKKIIFPHMEAICRIIMLPTNISLTIFQHSKQYI